MKLTPMDIHNKEFNVRLHGFDQQQVDEFLDDIIDSYSDALDKIADLENQIEELQNTVPTEIAETVISEPGNESENLSEAEQASQILLSAQKSADLITENAKKDAEKIINDAKNIAAENSNQGIDSTNIEYQAELQRNIGVLENDYERLKQRVADFREKTRLLLEKELDDLDDENWQYWLDRYYGTERLYPADGEPIEPNQVTNTNNDTDFLDSKEVDEVDLTGKIIPEMNGETIATGDNPTNVAMDLPSNDFPDDGPAIVFPQDDKN